MELTIGQIIFITALFMFWIGFGIGFCYGIAFEARRIRKQIENLKDD